MSGDCDPWRCDMCSRSTCILLLFQNLLLVRHIWGLGTCFCHCSSLIIVSRYFTRRLALANGLVALGSAVGALVLSPTFEYLIETFGIKATFKILSALQIVVILCGLVYRPYQDRNNIQERKRKFCHCSLFQNKAYVIWMISVAIYMLAYLLPYIHLVSYHLFSFMILSNILFYVREYFPGF